MAVSWKPKNRELENIRHHGDLGTVELHSHSAFFHTHDFARMDAAGGGYSGPTSLTR